MKVICIEKNQVCSTWFEVLHCFNCAIKYFAVYSGIYYQKEKDLYKTHLKVVHKKSFDLPSSCLHLTNPPMWMFAFIHVEGTEQLKNII